MPIFDVDREGTFNPKIRKLIQKYSILCIVLNDRGVCGVMVIAVGNGHDDTSSNPGRN